MRIEYQIDIYLYMNIHLIEYHIATRFLEKKILAGRESDPGHRNDNPT